MSLGNEFNKHTDKDAEGTLEAAWEVGVRYFDVAPWYGFGLAERRFGHFLHNKKREDYLLSSKVGKLFKASKNACIALLVAQFGPTALNAELSSTVSLTAPDWAIGEMYLPSVTSVERTPVNLPGL